MRANTSERGPQVYENWHAFIRKEELRGVSEFPLYSDARVTGQVTDRPYMFFNPVAHDKQPGFFRPTIYVRVEQHLKFDIPDMSKTDTTSFHGGTLIDEIGALVSLALGIRIRAGGMSRYFDVNGDPRGIAVEWTKQPQFLFIDYRNLVVANAASERALSLLAPLQRIPRMSPDDANALVKAARSYQKALLLAEDDPSMSWLLFVAAIEKAALQWKMKAAKKKLKLGDSKKFTEFVLDYLPDPSHIRPPDLAQVSWKIEDLRRSFTKIYEHRSKALHEATPFPQPMCDPPFRERKLPGVRYEKPFGLAQSSPGGTWVAKDLPMYLNTFEYIVRNALLKWWSGLGESS